LVPAGVFYVNLRGRYYSESNRRLALADPENARKMAYRHAGRFDQRALVKLDARPNATVGDQFNYRRNQDGTIRSGNPEAMTTKQFIAMLDSVAANLKRMGRDIYAGVASVAPYRKGTTTACDHCGYRSICRIDPWTHSFRLLRMDS
jgi:ATP-dependent helicase/nuclease subunit B